MAHVAVPQPFTRKESPVKQVAETTVPSDAPALIDPSTDVPESPKSSSKQDQDEHPAPVEELTAVEAQELPSEQNVAPVPAVQDPKSAHAARMARFKVLQAQKTSGRQANEKEAIEENKRLMGKHETLSKTQHAHVMAEFKLLKDGDPDFERKRNWDYTAEEDEKWGKRQTKKAKNRDINAFSDYRREANKVYKRQIKQMSQVDMETYAVARANKLQQQVASGLLELVETGDGEVYTVDKLGRINVPVEENYNCDHKPTKEAIDRLVGDLEKGERARLKARAARGLKDDDSGDVTYINHKNKQFNEKLSRFYNRYTTEIRESFERGTAI